MNTMDLIRQPDRLTLGIEMPLDNDWLPATDPLFAHEWGGGRRTGISRR